MKFGLRFGLLNKKSGPVVPPPALSALCPGDLTIPGGSDQTDVDAVFVQWMAGFGINQAGCVPSVSNLVSVPPGFTAPLVGAGGNIIVTNTVTDNCGQEDICESTFYVEAD